jgi:hypothetical protein
MDQTREVGAHLDEDELKGTDSPLPGRVTTTRSRQTSRPPLGKAETPDTGLPAGRGALALN